MFQKLCSWVLFKRLGWRMIGDAPTVDKYVFVGVPHTSNWDFIYAFLAVTSLGLNAKIFVKDTYYRWPIRMICDALGVVPVNRRKRTNFVDSVVEQFNSHERLAVLIAPEGTRDFKTGIKSGYYHIAKLAKVSIVVAGPNYKDKTFTIIPPREPFASFAEDEANVIAFSKSQIGKNPDNSFN